MDSLTDVIEDYETVVDYYDDVAVGNNAAVLGTGSHYTYSPYLYRIDSVKVVVRLMS